MVGCCYSRGFKDLPGATLMFYYWPIVVFNSERTLIHPFILLVQQVFASADRHKNWISLYLIRIHTVIRNSRTYLYTTDVICCVPACGLVM